MNSVRQKLNVDILGFFLSISLCPALNTPLCRARRVSGTSCLKGPLANNPFCLPQPPGCLRTFVKDVLPYLTCVSCTVLYLALPSELSRLSYPLLSCQLALRMFCRVHPLPSTFPKRRHPLKAENTKAKASRRRKNPKLPASDSVFVSADGN